MTYRRTHGTKEQCHWIFPPGAHSEPPGSENTTCHLLAHLHCDHGGQPTHCLDCGGKSNPGCPYVLLSWQLIIYGCCLFYYIHPRYDYKLTLWEKNHLFPSLRDPDFYRSLIWWCWDFASGGHGLWPLRGHLQALALFDNHESASVCSAAAFGLGFYMLSSILSLFTTSPSVAPMSWTTLCVTCTPC